MIRGRTLGHIVGETTGVIPRYAAPNQPCDRATVTVLHHT